jgi:hypothetical protein
MSIGSYVMIEYDYSRYCYMIDVHRIVSLRVLDCTFHDSYRYVHTIRRVGVQMINSLNHRYLHH